MQFRDRFDIPLSDEEVVGAPLYRPAHDSAEASYVAQRSAALGGPVPQRRSPPSDLTSPPDETFAEFHEGTGDREASTTMAFVRMLSRLLRDRELGPRIVPIVPDESRTFGMEGMFREFGNLRLARPALRAGRLRPPALLQGVARRPDSRRGHHRGRRDVLLHRRRDVLLHAQDADDPLLHLLLDVRVAADRRSGLRGGRRAHARLPDRRDRRAHHAQRRGTSASGRALPPARIRHPQPDLLRPRLRLRGCRDRAGGHPPHARARRGCLLLPDRRKRGLRPPADAGGRVRARGHSARHLPTGRAAQRRRAAGAAAGQRADPQ